MYGRMSSLKANEFLDVNDIFSNSGSIMIKFTVYTLLQTQSEIFVNIV